ncbi:MAG: prepilin peptidase [Bryobacteraceae bacterium]|jgi:prepilin peptidase CpaA
MTALAVLAGGVGVAASIDDLWRRQISNWIPCSALASGVILQSVEHGWRGVGSALGGTLAGAGVFLVFYLLGGMGGGDVKLMAGFGALLGVPLLLQAALWTAGCGGVMAVAVIATRAVRDWRTGSKRGRAGKPDGGGAAEPAHRSDSIPYAPAIAAGVWLSLAAAT